MALCDCVVFSSVVLQRDSNKVNDTTRLLQPGQSGSALNIRNYVNFLAVAKGPEKTDCND